MDIFNGLKLAAGGELGIGVGEEDWGSGEREVLEGFVERTEGIVDLVIARYGASSRTNQNTFKGSTAATNSQDINPEWQVPGESILGPADGVIFSGIGALSRASVKNISCWMEWLYLYGQDCYGVRDNPSSPPRRKRRGNQPYGPEYNASGQGPQKPQKSPISRSLHGQRSDSPSDHVAGIPASLLTPRSVLESQGRKPSSSSKALARNYEQGAANSSSQDSMYGTENIVKYLTLGVYGSRWGIPSGRPPIDRQVSSLPQEDNDQIKHSKNSGKEQPQKEFELSGGSFLVGLQGQLEEDMKFSEELETGVGTDEEAVLEDRTVPNNRIVIRTLHVERAKGRGQDSNKSQSEDAEPMVKFDQDRLRVVVYVQQPFIFTFLFERQTEALAIPSFYRSLHHQLGPLRRPLVASTSPSKVSERLWEAAAPKSTAPTKSSQPICDLVYDPARLTVHTTIPNIPEPGPCPADSGEIVLWTRMEAMSVHSQILNTYSSTRQHTAEQERTSKTSRQWWVVWMRLPQTGSARDTGSEAYREAFLIRKASDYVPPAARKSSGRFGREVSGSGAAGGGWGPGRLAEGIGIDARQYIEGLLSLNR